MDIIDYELKRYQTMQKDLQTKKDLAEQESEKSEKSAVKAKDHSKSADDLDALIDEEKPKEVS